MSRYYCAKKQANVTMKKANEWCLPKTRCTGLMIRKSILEKGRLKTILIPAIPVGLAEGEEC